MGLGLRHLVLNCRLGYEGGLAVGGDTVLNDLGLERVSVLLSHQAVDERVGLLRGRRALLLDADVGDEALHGAVVEARVDTVGLLGLVSLEFLGLTRRSLHQHPDLLAHLLALREVGLLLLPLGGRCGGLRAGVLVGEVVLVAGDESVLVLGELLAADQVLVPLVNNLIPLVDVQHRQAPAVHEDGRLLIVERAMLTTTRTPGLGMAGQPVVPLVRMHLERYLLAILLVELGRGLRFVLGGLDEGGPASVAVATAARIDETACLG